LNSELDQLLCPCPVLPLKCPLISWSLIHLIKH
jgi:hypothetical protein